MTSSYLEKPLRSEAEARQARIDSCTREFVYAYPVISQKLARKSSPWWSPFAFGFIAQRFRSAGTP